MNMPAKRLFLFLVLLCIPLHYCWAFDPLRAQQMYEIYSEIVEMQEVSTEDRSRLENHLQSLFQEEVTLEEFLYRFPKSEEWQAILTDKIRAATGPVKPPSLRDIAVEAGYISFTYTESFEGDEGKFSEYARRRSDEMAELLFRAIPGSEIKRLRIRAVTHLPNGKKSAETFDYSRPKEEIAKRAADVFQASVPASVSAAGAQPVIEFKSRSHELRVNGAIISENRFYREFVALLGPADRKTPKAENDVYRWFVYDRFGLALLIEEYIPDDEDVIVRAVSLYYRLPQTAEYSPKEKFTGLLKVDDAVFNPLQTKMKGLVEQAESLTLPPNLPEGAATVAESGPVYLSFSGLDLQIGWS
jgi:hypothetical protein